METLTFEYKFTKTDFFISLTSRTVFENTVGFEKPTGHLRGRPKATDFRLPARPNLFGKGRENGVGEDGTGLPMTASTICDTQGHDERTAITPSANEFAFRLFHAGGDQTAADRRDN